jgi:hypothetical protein
MLAKPYGEDGLKTDEAREVVSCLSSPPVGDQMGSLVIGPMDKASPRSSDVLLKILEDFDPNAVLPILWANDIEAVSPTVRSRCLVKRVDAKSGPDEEDPLWEAALDLDSALREGDVPRICRIVIDAKGSERELLEYLVEYLSSDLTGEGLQIWNRLRPLFSFGRISRVEVLCALLPGKIHA